MATDGLLILNPTPETLWHYGEIESKRARSSAQLTGLRETKSTTRDGRHIVLSANIELPEDVEAVAAQRRGRNRTLPHGISLPESNHAADRGGTIRNLSKGGGAACSPHPLIIRTFDLGGDKVAGAIDISR